MKKFFMIALVVFVAVGLTACGDKDSNKDDESESTESIAEDKYPSQGMCEDETPIPAPDKSAPKTVEPGSGKTPYIVDFSATWCGPCQQLKPYFMELEETYAGQAEFRTVDIDENQALAMKHNVNAVPTVIIFSDSTMSTELYRVTGLDPQGLSEAIMNFI